MDIQSTFPEAKPPLGLTPKRIHDSARLSDIQAACQRYIDASLNIPYEWVRELLDLQRQLDGQQEQPTPPVPQAVPPARECQTCKHEDPSDLGCARCNDHDNYEAKYTSRAGDCGSCKYWKELTSKNPVHCQPCRSNSNYEPATTT